MNCFRLMTCVAACVALAGRADAQVLYASTSSGAAGELYTLNPANGNSILNIGPLNDSSGQNYPVTGLAFNPVDGMLYGSTGNNIGATSWARLVKINPATAQVTVVGLFNAGPVDPSGKPTTMSDLAFTSTGTLYGVASIGGPNLYTIDLVLGQATLVGGSGLTSTSGGGLAISPGGTFYGTPTATRFGTYDPTTGAYTNIGTPALPAGGAYAALAFNGPVLYGMDSGTGSPAPNHLVTIDPSTGTVTDLGLSNLTSLDAIAFGPAAVPEPGTLGLVGGAVVLGVLRAVRRRKAATV
jgi:hypothetical protein